MGGSYPEARISALFKVSELQYWLVVARVRWGDGVTGRLEGNAINVYQDGVYRAAIRLDESPCLVDWADDDA